MPFKSDAADVGAVLGRPDSPQTLDVQVVKVAGSSLVRDSADEKD